MSIDNLRELLDLFVYVEVTMLVATRIDGQSQHCANEEGLGLPDLAAFLAVLLELEECLLDEVLGFLSGASTANQHSLQPDEIFWKPSHGAYDDTRLVTVSTPPAQSAAGSVR
jgi:hypothetical protein